MEQRLIFDADIHQGFKPGELEKRLPSYFRQSHFALPTNHYKSPVGVSRADAKPDKGGAGSDYALLSSQHMDNYGITYGLLTGSVLAVGIHPDIDYGNAYAAAYNDTMQETWLTWDKRFFASLVINPCDPKTAAAEIRKRGNDPRLLEVLFCSATTLPLGHRFYWPIYEAAAEVGLPISVHPGTESRGTSNRFIAGAPVTYFEWHTNLPQNYMGQVVSMLCQGVFEQFPTLKFVAKEGGLGWVPGVLWRLDKNWKSLRSSVPWLKRLPSEILLDHVRFTSQPIEEPAKPEHLFQLFDMIEAHRTLLFSSDYPHWDNDCPTHALPRMPNDLAERIFWKNADEVYNFTTRAERIQ